MPGLFVDANIAKVKTAEKSTRHNVSCNFMTT